MKNPMSSEDMREAWESFVQSDPEVHEPFVVQVVSWNGVPDGYIAVKDGDEWFLEPYEE